MTPTRANSAAAAVRIVRLFMTSTAVAYVLAAGYVFYLFGVQAHPHRMTLAVVIVVVVGVFDLIAMGSWYHLAKARARKQYLTSASPD